MQHIILLGDSILDNAAYVSLNSDVISYLRKALPEAWKATLIARDGSLISDIQYQLDRLPTDSSFLILSIGGNDALSHADILNQSANSFAEVLLKFSDIQDEFQKSYNLMLNNVLSYNLPTAICTIYYPRFPDPIMQKISVVALSIFNDCIIREAIGWGLKLIDLRLICSNDEDYATPIEPSEKGSEKIASAILKIAQEYNSTKTE